MCCVKKKKASEHFRTFKCLTKFNLRSFSKPKSEFLPKRSEGLYLQYPYHLSITVIILWYSKPLFETLFYLKLWRSDLYRIFVSNSQCCCKNVPFFYEPIKIGPDILLVTRAHNNPRETRTSESPINILYQWTYLLNYRIKEVSLLGTRKPILYQPYSDNVASTLLGTLLIIT